MSHDRRAGGVSFHVIGLSRDSASGCVNVRDLSQQHVIVQLFCSHVT